MIYKIKLGLSIFLFLIGVSLFTLHLNEHFYFSILIIITSLTGIVYYSYQLEKKNYGKKIEILNDYIIIEPIEVNQSTGLHRTVQDQSKLVYRDALVKFTPKNSIVKPGDTVIFNKSMAYPYILDGKQHLIITEEYIVCIK